MNKPDIENRASRTAMYAALYRYLSLFESNPVFSSRDTLSGLFVPPVIKFILTIRWFRQRVRRKMHNKVPGTYEYVIARTRFFDDQFINALEKRVPQIVILGAGYDTRAIRYRECTAESQVYELDSGVLLAGKQKIYRKNRVSIPSNLIFCPIIFGRASIAEVLVNAGYDATEKSLFLWEGVSYYLTESAVQETLAFICSHAGTGSELLFDYFYQSFIDGHCDTYGAKGLYDSVARTGEPYLFGIEEDKLELFLSAAGFEMVCKETPSDLEVHYLTDNGNCLGKVYGFAECVRAGIKGDDI